MQRQCRKMKNIVVVETLPHILSTEKDLEDALLKGTTAQLLVQPQKNKASTTKILRKDFPTSNEIFTHKVPNFMKTLHIDGDYHLVGIPSLFNNETKSRLKDDNITKVTQYFREQGCTAIMDLPDSLLNTNTNYAKKRFRNILNACVWDDIYAKPLSFEDYVSLNKVYCEKIEEIYEPGDCILIHTHFGWLLPAMLKKKFKDAKICLLVSTNLPNTELMRSITQAEDIANSIIKCNAVVVQNTHDRTNLIQFLQYFLPISVKKDIIELEGNELKISVQNFCSMDLECNTIIQKDYPKLLRNFKGMKVILSVADQYNQVAHSNALLAIDRYLQLHDEKIGLLIVDIVNEDYIDFETCGENSRMISYLRKKHKNLHIECFQPKVDAEFDFIVQNCDLALFLSERDTTCIKRDHFLVMNHKNPKPLICSKFSDQDFEYGVEPKNAIVITDRIHELLYNMDAQVMAELYNKHHKLREIDAKYLKSAVNTLNSGQKSKHNTIDDCSPILDAFKRSKNPVLLLDYDGTLVPICDSPESAKPTEALINLLKKLSQKMQVVIVTGRSKQIMDEWFPLNNLSISAEHGVCFRQNNKWTSKSYCTEWKKSASDLFQYFHERLPESVFETKDSCLCFHYRMCDPNAASTVVRLLKSAINKIFHADDSLRIVEGKCILELRVGTFDKGDFVREYCQDHNFDFILTAGDDKTDEDMFKASFSMDNSYSLHIGISKTQARYRISNVKDFLGILEKML